MLMIAALTTLGAFGACGAQPGETTTPARAARPPATAELDVPPADASAPDEIETTPDASAPSSDASVFGSSDPLALSPTIRARGAIVRSDHSQQKRVILLRSAAKAEHCKLADDDPEILAALCSWSSGSDCRLQAISFSDGGRSRYSVHIKVLDAPTRKGARGRVELEDSDATNIHGGIIDALVCD